MATQAVLKVVVVEGLARHGETADGRPLYRIECPVCTVFSNPSQAQVHASQRPGSILISGAEEVECRHDGGS